MSWQAPVSSLMHCLAGSRRRRLSPERGEEEDASEFDSVAWMVLGELASPSRSDKEAVPTCSRATVDCSRFSVAEEVECGTRSVAEDADFASCPVAKVLDSVSPSVVKEVDSFSRRSSTRPLVRKWKRAAARATRYARHIFAKV